MRESGSPFNRRWFLGAATAGFLSVAGCLGGETTTGDDEVGQPTATARETPTETRTPTQTRTPIQTQTRTQTQTPTDTVVAFEDLSPAAQHEVRTAIQQGSYETCGMLALSNEVDLRSNPIIKYQGELYEPVIAVGSGKNGRKCSKRILQMDDVEETPTLTPSR